MALTMAMFAGLALWFLPPGRHPPKEEDLLRNFKDHRAAFEQLRDMLLVDKQVRRVADWGVDTINPTGIFTPPAGNFPTNRFNQYLALLAQAGGELAIRSEGDRPDCGIIVWSTGFAGDTRHIGISWEDPASTNLVSHLYDSSPRRVYGEDWQNICQHIDGHWYLWRDW